MYYLINFIANFLLILKCYHCEWLEEEKLPDCGKHLPCRDKGPSTCFAVEDICKKFHFKAACEGMCKGKSEMFNDKYSEVECYVENGVTLNLFEYCKSGRRKGCPEDCSKSTTQSSTHISTTEKDNKSTTQSSTDISTTKNGLIIAMACIIIFLIIIITITIVLIRKYCPEKCRKYKRPQPDDRDLVKKGVETTPNTLFLQVNRNAENLLYNGSAENHQSNGNVPDTPDAIVEGNGNVHISLDRVRPTSRAFAETNVTPNEALLLNIESTEARLSSSYAETNISPNNGSAENHQNNENAGSSSYNGSAENHQNGTPHPGPVQASEDK